MFKLLPLIVLCSTCSPAGGSAGEGVSPAYATQSEAPAPDYKALLAQAKAPAEGWRTREPTGPMPPDAKQVGAAWVAGLEERGALLGYGLAGKSPDGPVNQIDTGLSEAEFDAWARENGWSVPRHIRWSFVPPLALPAVSEAAKDAIRVWPASTARTGAQNQALFRGRVELRDGCFFVGEGDGPADKLAWFHAEIGLDRDPQGFYILRERVGGQVLARLGEAMNWGGPASAVIGESARTALHDACGEGEVYVVGSPESAERFMTQHPHLRDPVAPPPPRR